MSTLVLLTSVMLISCAAPVSTSGTRGAPDAAGTPRGTGTPDATGLSGAPDAPGAPGSGGQFHALNGAILTEVNRARQRVGAPPLQVLSALDHAALDYAVELAARGLLDHYSPIPGRETMSRRVTASGVRWRRAAENLYSRGGPASDLAVMTVAGWMNSAGHRSSMLDPSFTRSGIGVARDAAGAWYVVQLYVLPMGAR